jgi:hypothetical protein
VARDDDVQGDQDVQGDARVPDTSTETKAEALAKVHDADATEYLNVEFAKESDTTEAKKEHATWNAVKQQVFGAK